MLFFYVVFFSKAIIKVVLDNRGVDKFGGETWADEIVIQREITRNGASTTKITSRNGINVLNF